MKIKSLKNKLLYTLFFLIFLAAIITSVTIGIFSYKQQYNKEQENLAILTETQATIIDVFLEDAKSICKNLAKNKDVIEAIIENDTEKSKIKINEILSGFNINNHYSAIYITDKLGMTLFSTDESFIGNDYSFRGYFKDAISNKSGLDMLVGVTSKKAGYYFSEPIKYNNEIIGVLVMKMESEPIESLIEKQVIGESGKIMIANEDGIIIYSDIPERLYKSLGKLDEKTEKNIIDKKEFAQLEITPLSYEPIYELIKNKKITKTESLVFYDEQDGEKEILTISPLKETTFYVIFEEELEKIKMAALGISLIFSLLSFLLNILNILGVSFLLKKLLSPLDELKEMTKKIGRSNFIQKNNIKTGDELESLGEVLVDMSSKLKLLYTKLEDKVKERTKDLENEKKNLEKFKLALDNASDHIVITDAEGAVIYGNKSVERITGYKLNEVMHKKAGKIWGGIMDKEYYEKMWDIIKNKKKVFTGLLQNKRKNGEIYDASISISPVLNKNNKVEFFVGIERDVTKEKEVDRAKTEFVSLASHQLRTPLSSINWYSEMLLDGDAGDLKKEQKKFVNEIYKGNQRMVNLVNSLLNVSRLELGTFTIEPEKVDICNIAKSVLNELKPGIKNKKIKITTEFKKNIPDIKADPKLIRIIFQNLLSNSIKYTPKQGNVGIKIQKKGKNILITVSDNGYGIPKNQQEKIFSKLFRADNIKSMDTEGTGLGLYIIKSIIDHSGGKIWFKSQEKKGTSFFVNLPLSGMKAKEGTKTID